MITADHKEPISGYSPDHLGGLRRFAVAITILTVIGHLFLGFEASYLQPLVSVGVAYAVQLFLETLSAWAWRRPPRYAGGFVPFVNFLLSAHIAGLAIAMLLYFHDRLWDVAFASAVAIGSKTIFRIPTPTGWRHFLNPSNFAVSVTLLLCPGVGLAMPWQYTAALSGDGDWLLVALIWVLGTLINLRYTKRIGVVIGFLVGFVTQALIRWWVFGSPLLAVIMPATGVSAAIYTFYMTPDPATTPTCPRRQFLFGFSIAAVYLVMMRFHVVFGLFYALTLVSAIRGLTIAASTLFRSSMDRKQPQATVMTVV